MAQSMNTKVDCTEKGTSNHGFTTYGNLMVGDRAFEFYNERNVNDYVQIPWEEVDYVSASVLFGGKIIPRFAIHTKKNGTFSFSARNAKRVLRAIREYIPADKMLRSLSMLDIFKKKLGFKK